MGTMKASSVRSPKQVSPISLSPFARLFLILMMMNSRVANVEKAAAGNSGYPDCAGGGALVALSTVLRCGGCSFRSGRFSIEKSIEC
jgi:hypothetical protein